VLEAQKRSLSLAELEPTNYELVEEEVKAKGKDHGPQRRQSTMLGRVAKIETHDEVAASFAANRCSQFTISAMSKDMFRPGQSLQANEMQMAAPAPRVLPSPEPSIVKQESPLSPLKQLSLLFASPAMEDGASSRQGHGVQMSQQSEQAVLTMLARVLEGQGRLEEQMDTRFNSLEKQVDILSKDMKHVKSAVADETLARLRA